jgi:hypothetical protein
LPRTFGVGANFLLAHFQNTALWPGGIFSSWEHKGREIESGQGISKNILARIKTNEKAYPDFLHR